MDGLPQEKASCSIQYHHTYTATGSLNRLKTKEQIILTSSTPMPDHNWMQDVFVQSRHRFTTCCRSNDVCRSVESITLLVGRWASNVAESFKASVRYHALQI